MNLQAKHPRDKSIFCFPYHLSQTRAYHVMLYLEIKTGEFLFLRVFF